MKKSKRLMAFLMSVMMVVSLMVNEQLSGGFRVYAEEEVASDTDATEMGDEVVSVTEDSSDMLEDEEMNTEQPHEDEVIETVEVDEDFDNSTYVGDNYEVTLTLDSYWDSGYNATITIKNTGDTVIENWCMAFPLEQNISNIWNASIEEVHEDYFVIKNAGWNQDIAVDGSVSFGITCYEAFSVYPEYYTLLGNEVELASGDYSVAYEITEDWGEGYKALVTITNNKSVALEDWRIKFNYGDNVITQIWDAVIVDNTDGCYEISCESYNQNIEAGQSVTFGFLVEPGCSGVDVTDISVSEYVSDVPDETDGRYVSVMVIANSAENELALVLNSSEECDSYAVYESVDGGEFTLVGETDVEVFTMILSGSYTKKELYVIGRYGTDGEVKSNSVFVEYVNGEYIAIDPDNDGDGLNDAWELFFGSDSDLEDTDGDGLGDYYEAAETGTDPTLADTDGDGIEDGYEDLDGDGLDNFTEKDLGTNPQLSDTDADDLKDGDEVGVYFTDPFDTDSDDDGLIDGDEPVLGTDPTDPDTDDDGILDGDEFYEQIFTHEVENDCAVTSVEVTVNGKGNIQKTTSVESIMNRDVLCTDVVGLVGEPFEIECGSEFDGATITFYINPDMLGDTRFEDLMFLWYDEENYKFVELETVCNDEDYSVSVTTTHFSKYMVVDSSDWFEAWAEDINYNPGLEVSGPAVYNYNTVLVVDCSGSMSYNDPITYKNVGNATDAQYPKTCARIQAGYNYIKTMNWSDKVAVIMYSYVPEVITDFTNDKETLKQAFQHTYSYGDTNTDEALVAAADLFSESDLSSPTARNRIILLTDGQGGITDKTISYIADKGVTVYGVGFDTAVDERLRKLTEVTGGEYYYEKTGEEIIDLYEFFGYIDDFDTTDTDGDGLYDAVETAGMRVQNDRIIYTDPTDDDTDGDGLLDSEEILPKVMVKFLNELVGSAHNPFQGVFNKKSYYFIMVSDPTSVDSDDDGLLDNQRIFYDGKVMVPIDPHKLSYDGPEGVWKEQADIANEGTFVATKYTSSPTSTNEEFNEIAKDADYIVGILLLFGDIIEDNETVINYITSNLKLGAEFFPEEGADILDFIYDEKGQAYHSQINTWQREFGYNEVYDIIFNYATDMMRGRYFFDYNGIQHVLWLWKGDYWNLQTGAELGLYSYGYTANYIEHYNVVDYEIPMTLTVYNSYDTYVEPVLAWVPKDDQWWVTGFNIDYMLPVSTDIAMISSADFSHNSRMYDAVKEGELDKKMNGEVNIIFDDEYQTIWFMWK